MNTTSLKLMAWHLGLDYNAVLPRTGISVCWGPKFVPESGQRSTSMTNTAWKPCHSRLVALARSIGAMRRYSIHLNQPLDSCWSTYSPFQGSGDLFAVKCVNFATLSSRHSACDDALKSQRHESRLLQSIHSPYIVRAVDVFEGERDRRVYTVLEPMRGGDLADHLCSLLDQGLWLSDAQVKLPKKSAELLH